MCALRLENLGGENALPLIVSAAGGVALTAAVIENARSARPFGLVLPLGAAGLTGLVAYAPIDLREPIRFFLLGTVVMSIVEGVRTIYLGQAKTKKATLGPRLAGLISQIALLLGSTAAYVGVNGLHGAAHQAYRVWSGGANGSWRLP